MAGKKAVAKKPKQKSKLGIDVLKAFFENAEELARIQADPKKHGQLLKYAETALGFLDCGEARVWEPSTDTVNIWCKNAILTYFRVRGAKPMNAGCFEFFDKIALKRRSSLKNVRVAPGAVARFGSFLSPGVILMPSFVNIGAYVGSGTMVDAWATVGSCAQIGAGVHLSGGVGIGGVLEPAQAKPVVIEDGAFIGSRVIVVEGVRIGREAVLGAGVVLTASTKIVDVRGGKAEITTGVVPERSVVIPGSLPKKFPAGEYGVPCALIIGTRSASTDLKTSLNAALRDHQVAI